MKPKEIEEFNLEITTALNEKFGDRKYVCCISYDCGDNIEQGQGQSHVFTNVHFGKDPFNTVKGILFGLDAGVKGFIQKNMNVKVDEKQPKVQSTDHR